MTAAPRLYGAQIISHSADTDFAPPPRDSIVCINYKGIHLLDPVRAQPALRWRVRVAG